MLILVEIDLSKAELDLFEQYERSVLPLLANHGGTLLERLRSIDGSNETHLIQFTDASRLEAFKADPTRKELQALWASCGATATLKEVVRIE